MLSQNGVSNPGNLLTNQFMLLWKTTRPKDEWWCCCFKTTQLSFSMKTKLWVSQINNFFLSGTSYRIVYYVCYVLNILTYFIIIIMTHLFATVTGTTVDAASKIVYYIVIVTWTKLQVSLIEFEDPYPVIFIVFCCLMLDCSSWV